MERPVIYQILVRLFGNKQKPQKEWGSIKENGTGKMNDITDKALSEIKKMGFNHVWYTGLIEHATCTSYSEYGIPADHPSVVKGVAGSPYAIKDYYDIAPDLAGNIAERMSEFEQLVKRSHDHGLKVIIDFVPNHLARQYQSDVKPDRTKDFGSEDDVTVPFSPSNNFYYVPGEELSVPHSDNNQQTFDHPYHESPAKATGNDVFSHQPSINDWYETIKLNYGVDYQNHRKSYFDPIPDTWLKMRDILLFWAGKGVDGFRCDMAEMVPVEFWQWVIREVKAIKKEIIFIAEVYQPDQYRNYIHEGGFDYLYDKVGLYDTLKSVIQGHSSADHITRVWQSQEGISNRMLRFLENHDEQRIASPWFAGEAIKGIPMMAATAFMHYGPVMVYFGQEVGEPAKGASGFSGDDGRTTIFDYWNVPEHQKWMNKGTLDGKKLSKEQNKLRQQYIKILQSCNEHPLLQSGDFYDLQYFNRSDRFKGYTDKVFTFIRHDREQGLLVVINFFKETEHIRIKIPVDFIKKIDPIDSQHLSIDREIFNITEISDPESPVQFQTNLPAYSYQLIQINSSK